MATALETAKTALRISHSKLDDELTRLIDAALADMMRAGVSSARAVISDTGEISDPLVMQAVITYCLLNSTEETNLIDKYVSAYETQVEGLRRQSGE